MITVAVMIVLVPLCRKGKGNNEIIILTNILFIIGQQQII